MRIPNVDTGSIERGAERAVGIPRPLHGARRARELGDSAAISDDGRERLQAFERLAARLHVEDPARSALVDAARARLESGALDDADVYRAVAEKLLRD